MAVHTLPEVSTIHCTNDWRTIVFHLLSRAVLHSPDPLHAQRSNKKQKIEPLPYIVSVEQTDGKLYKFYIFYGKYRGSFECYNPNFLEQYKEYKGYDRHLISRRCFSDEPSEFFCKDQASQDFCSIHMNHTWPKVEETWQSWMPWLPTVASTITVNRADVSVPDSVLRVKKFQKIPMMNILCGGIWKDMIQLPSDSVAMTYHNAVLYWSGEPDKEAACIGFGHSGDQFYFHYRKPANPLEPRNHITIRIMDWANPREGLESNLPRIDEFIRRCVPACSRMLFWKKTAFLGQNFNYDYHAFLWNLLEPAPRVQPLDVERR